MIPEVKEVIAASADAVRKLGAALETAVEALQEEIERKPGGVYVVSFVDVGLDNVVWTFTSEKLADDVCALINVHVGEASVAYEPTSSSLDDDHLIEYLKDRVGADGHRLAGEDDRLLIERLIMQAVAIRGA